MDGEPTTTYKSLLTGLTRTRADHGRPSAPPVTVERYYLITHHLKSSIAIVNGMPLLSVRFAPHSSAPTP